MCKLQIINMLYVVYLFKREKRGISLPGDSLQLQLQCLQFSPDLPQLRDLQCLVRLTLLAVTGEEEGALTQKCKVLVFSIKIKLQALKVKFTSCNGRRVAVSNILSMFYPLGSHS